MVIGKTRFGAGLLVDGFMGAACKFSLDFCADALDGIGNCAGGIQSDELRGGSCEYWDEEVGGRVGCVFSSEISMVYFLSLRLLRDTLRAMRLIAIMNVATAATDSPAICAGVMVFGPGAGPVTTGAVVGLAVDSNDEVAEEIVAGNESITTELVEVGRSRIDAVNVEDCFIVTDELGEAMVGPTVIAVRVGLTAFFCPKQMLYVAGAWSIVGQDEYMHRRAASPRVSPSSLYWEHRQLISS